METVSSYEDTNSNQIDQATTKSSRKSLASLGYLLTRDRAKRQVKPTRRYGFANYMTYALVAFQDLVKNELTAFKEAINSKQAS